MNEPLRANARSFGDRYLLFFCRIHPSSSRSGFSSANRHKHLLALILAISTALSAQYNALYFSQDGTLNALSYETIDVFDFSNDKTTTISEELFRPFGMAQLKDGNYIVADSGNSTVKILDKQGICLSSFGKTGNGDTDLMSPLGLALDSRENVIISDTGNNCIKVFDKAGKLLLKFGKRGYGESEFLNPFHVFTDREDNIYVVDPGNICVKKFNKEGKFLLKFSDGLKSVSDAAIDNEGNVFICDFKDRRVKIFSKTSAYLTFYLDDYYYQEPILIAISLTNDIAVTDKGKNRLEVMRKGKPVYTKQGYEDNRSGNLYSATVGKDKTIYATYFSSDYIFCYDGTGKFLRKFGGSGEAPGLFNQPRGIAVDSRGRVFLCDSFNKRIQYFSKEGLFLGELTPLDWPLQLTIDHEDYLYVSESGTSSIYKLRVPVPSGTGEIQENEHLSKIQASDFFNPGPININKGGLIGVVNTLNKAFLILDKNGKQVFSYNLSLKAPVSVASDNEGFFYVYDAYNADIYKFAQDKLIGKTNINVFTVESRHRAKYGALLNMDGKIKFFNGNTLIEVNGEYK